MKKEIIKEIEEQVSKSRTTYSSEMLQSKSGKNGALLPLVVIGTTLTLFLGTLLFVFIFNTRTKPITVTRNVSEIGAINQIIKKLKEQANSEIENKQNEIKKMLGNLKSESANLETEKIKLTEKITSKKNQNEIEINNKIEKEKARLLKLKLANEELKFQLEKYENTLRNDYNQKLINYKKELEKNISLKENTLKSLENEYKEKVKKTKLEIKKIRDKASQQEREFDQKLIAAQKSILKGIKAANSELADLQKEKEKEERLSLQLKGYYVTVNDQIKSGQIKDAMKSLKIMRKFIKSDLYLSSPSLTKSAQSDLLINNLLQDYISEKQAEIKQKEMEKDYNFKKDPQLMALETEFENGINKTQAAIKSRNFDLALQYLNSTLKSLPLGDTAISALALIINNNKKQKEEEIRRDFSKKYESTTLRENKILEREYQTKISQLKSEKRNLEITTDKLKNENNNYRKNEDLKNKKIEELLKEISALRKTSASTITQDDIAKLNLKLKNSENELDKAKEELAKSKITIEELEKRVMADLEASENTQIIILTNQLSKEKSKTKQLKREILSNKEKIEDYDKQVAAKENIKKILMQKNKALIESQKKIEELNNKLQNQ